MYFVKCSYCGTTYESEKESELHCPSCGAANGLEDIVKRTSGNYFKQAAEQDYADVVKGTKRRPQTEFQKVHIMEKNKRIALLLELGVGSGLLLLGVIMSLVLK